MVHSLCGHVVCNARPPWSVRIDVGALPDRRLWWRRHGPLLVAIATAVVLVAAAILAFSLF